MASHSSILAWRIPQRSLVGYSSWGGKESDTTERLKNNKASVLFFRGCCNKLLQS